MAIKRKKTLALFSSALYTHIVREISTTQAVEHLTSLRTTTLKPGVNK